MPTTYHIRPGRYADLPASADLYRKSFDKEPLFAYMFPHRRTDPTGIKMFAARTTEGRYWTPGYSLTMLVEKEEGKEGERPVAFSWWKRPASSLSFRERWLTPFAWISPLVRALISLRDYLFPIPTQYPDRLGVYFRTFATVEPQILNTQARRDAWYLASLGVEPEMQGSGLGNMVLRDGLRQADEAGAMTWLTGAADVEKYYERYDFVEVGRCNVGELKDWAGGSVMFRGEEKLRS